MHSEKSLNLAAIGICSTLKMANTISDHIVQIALLGHNRLVLFLALIFVRHQNHWQAKIWAPVDHSCQSIFFRTFLMMRYLYKKILISVINFFKNMKCLVNLSTNVPKIKEISHYILLFYLYKRKNPNYLIIRKVRMKIDWQEWSI